MCIKRGIIFVSFDVFKMVISYGYYHVMLLLHCCIFNLTGVSPSNKFSSIHTSIYSHHIPGSFTHLHPRWTDDRFAGTTIMYNFASALLVAKRKFGVSIQILSNAILKYI